MHADPVASPRGGYSGHHRDAPPGVLIAAGPPIRGAGADLRAGATIEIPESERSMPTLGTVYDVAPTVLYLLGTPVARDFEGGVMRSILREGLYEGRPPDFVDGYGDIWTPQGGPAIETEMDAEAIERLKSLGYLGGEEAAAADRDDAAPGDGDPPAPSEGEGRTQEPPGR
jgi:hypothetical protein